MNKLTVSASPHITKKENSTRMIMLDVLIALAPALIAATYFFGYHVIINAIICMGTCFGAEILFTLIKEKDFSAAGVKKSKAFDLSPLVTGLILALNIPSKIIVPKWNLNIYQAGYSVASQGAANYINFSFDTVFVCMIGSIFAIMLVKMMFGGIGKNFANPAAAARIFLMLSFGLAAVQTIGLGISASSGATWLAGTKRTNNQSMFLNMFLGNRGASAVGETSILALLLGGVYLSIKKVIDFRMPIIAIGSVAVFALLFDGALGGIPGKVTGAKVLNNVFANVMSGGVVFAAIFMATDYSTTPNTFWGKVIFNVGFGFFTMLIRRFASMPEGASFAILIMNVITPLLDKFIVPKPFGYVKPVKKPKKPVNQEHKPSKIQSEVNN